MYNVKEYVKFTNVNGGTITFDAVSIEGLGDVGAEIQTQRSPYQDGSTFIDTVLEPRYISVEFIVRGDSYEDVVRKRSAIASVINPKLGIGELTYMVGDGGRVTEKMIGAVAESVPFYPDKDNRGKRWQRGTVTFKAPNPYWQSKKIKAKPLFEPLFKFPFSGKFRMGYQRDRQIILNDGDVATPLYIELFGPAVAPKITNETTGEFIRVNRELSEGEHLRINTARGRQKSVIHVDANGTETNAFHWIDLESTFFQLELGENVLVYSADSNIQGATINIEYRKLYVSV